MILLWLGNRSDDGEVVSSEDGSFTDLDGALVGSEDLDLSGVFARYENSGDLDVVKTLQGCS